MIAPTHRGKALRDDTLPDADMHAELWGRNKRQRPEGEHQKPDMMARHKAGGRRKR